MKSDLGIVIVNWNNGDVISDCLKSIEKAGYLQSVVVVDNGSEEKLKVKSKKLKVKVIENGENLGYAGGNNVGIKYFLDLHVPYIFILNPDTEIDKDTIPRLIEVMTEDKDIGIAGPKILSPSPLGSHLNSSTPGESWLASPLQPATHGVIWSWGGIIDKNRYSGGLNGLGEIDNGQYDNLKKVDYIPGTAMMVRREVFEKCGLFNPDYFIYYEDVELSRRALHFGWQLEVVPDAVIIHKESSSLGKKSPAQEYYMARNHLLFVERNAPIIIKLRELLRLSKTLYEHWQKKEKYALFGIRDYFARRFGQHSP